MALIVVAASTKNQDFAVIDFAKSPPKTVMVTASAAGNVVDCYACFVGLSGFEMSNSVTSPLPQSPTAASFPWSDCRSC